MRLTKEILKIFKSNKEDKNYIDFEESNNLLVLSRIRLVSIAVIFMTVFLFYFDFVILKNVEDEIFKINIFSLHLMGVVASIVYLIFYKRIIKRKDSGRFNLINIIPKVYVLLFVLVGILHSINSQRLTGNIYTYIIMTFTAAIILNIKPFYMLIAFGINHTIFLISINILNENSYDFASKVMNSTIMIVIALLMSYTFYKYRMNDYINNKKMQESEENFKKLFHINPFPVFVTRLEDGKIIKASKKASGFFGLTQEELENIYVKDLYLKEEDRLLIIDELIRKNSINNHIIQYNIKGDKRWVIANYDLIDYHGEKCILTGVMDITEKKKTEEKLAKYASTDMLTGITNRRIGVDIIQELIDESKITYKEFVLCFVDINNLKSVNDTHGHGEGDNYLKVFSNLVIQELPTNDIFFRLGGDEFIIIFKDKNLIEADNIWNKIFDNFNRTNKLGQKPYLITASHGLFHFKSGMDFNPEQIIDMADKQMYIEKLGTKQELQ